MAENGEVKLWDHVDGVCLKVRAPPVPGDEEMYLLSYLRCQTQELSSSIPRPIRRVAVSIGGESTEAGDGLGLLYVVSEEGQDGGSVVRSQALFEEATAHGVTEVMRCEEEVYAMEWAPQFSTLVVMCARSIVLHFAELAYNVRCEPHAYTHAGVVATVRLYC